MSREGFSRDVHARTDVGQRWAREQWAPGRSDAAAGVASALCWPTDPAQLAPAAQCYRATACSRGSDGGVCFCGSNPPCGAGEVCVAPTVTGGTTECRPVARCR